MQPNLIGGLLITAVLVLSLFAREFLRHGVDQVEIQTIKPNKTSTPHAKETMTTKKVLITGVPDATDRNAIQKLLELKVPLQEQGTF